MSQVLALLFYSTETAFVLALWCAAPTDLALIFHCCLCVQWKVVEIRQRSVEVRLW